MRAAVVGIGVISKSHIVALRELGEEIVALCDTDVEKAEAAREAYGLDCPIYRDYLTMLDEIKPDTVHICTPHHLHADMVVEALSRNIHALCEKPLCIRKEDISRILEAEKASQARLGVVHQNRYNGANLFVKRLLAEHPIKCAHGEVVWRRDGEYYRSADWRGRWETEGGGVMINQALHTLDLLQWFAGFPDYLSASVSLLRRGEDIEVEDTAVAFFEGNIPFDIFATVASDSSYSVCIRINTEDGLRLTVLPHMVVTENEVLFSEEPRPTVNKASYGNGHRPLFEDFYSAIRDNRPFDLNGEEASRVVRLILGMYESGGKRIEI
ncbi:MAG: Gfo/Idh/MocA family oxidoreductase [Clostridia bacterium]|nr:Gfo/Idh/MocA family oxidoreductase [Clostridia bacterium]